eukprot:5875229-Amphidinium_carterae.1
MLAGESPPAERGVNPLEAKLSAGDISSSAFNGPSDLASARLTKSAMGRMGKIGAFTSRASN